MTRKTTRLYYGLHPETGDRLYWTLKVTNAKKAVELNGTILHAMSGAAGKSIGCHLSNAAMGDKKAFPHPALYVSFTKSVALVITKITRGAPDSCVRYRHSYSKYVDLNDRGLSKTLLEDHPDFFNRKFILRPYKDQPSHWKPEYGRKETGVRSQAQMLRGELARMKKAGLILQDL